MLPGSFSPPVKAKSGLTARLGGSPRTATTSVRSGVAGLAAVFDAPDDGDEGGWAQAANRSVRPKAISANAGIFRTNILVSSVQRAMIVVPYAASVSHAGWESRLP